MDTKWKKSKITAGLLTIFLGFSFLIACAAVNPVLVLGGMAEISPLFGRNASWEQTGDFREEAADLLNDLIRIGAGQPPSYGVYSYSEDYESSDSTRSSTYITAAITDTEDITFSSQDRAVEGAAGDAVITVKEDLPEEAQMRDFGENMLDWSPEEIQEMGETFHENHKEDKNVLYEVKKDGKVLYENLEGQTIGGPKNTLPEGYDLLLRYDGDKVNFYRGGTKLDVYGDGIYESDGKHWRVPGYQNYKVPKDWESCEVTLAVRSVPVRCTVGSSVYGNGLYRVYRQFQKDQRYFYVWCCAAAAGLVLLFLTHFLKKERRDGEKAIGAFLGRIPCEILLAVILIPVMFGLGGTIYTSDLLLDFLICFWLLRFLWLDLKYGEKPWKNSLIVKLVHFLETKEMEMPVQERLADQFSRPILLMLASVILALLAFLAENVLGLGIAGLFFILAVLCFAAMGGLLFYNAWQQKRLALDLGHLCGQIDAAFSGKERGAYELPADSDLAEMAEKVAGISDGFEEAVEERMKSERMKVELVANVSHDIKTPLTSIISYVDLLKDEENLPEDLKEYVEILSQKSERLKTMVQDIFEVSKAASGQLPVKMEVLDLGKLLRQTMADMAEQIEAAPVSVRPQIPEEPVLILADGQRMYRVFQNLLQNALQYSLEGSRIYLTLEKQGSLAVASVRNTSAAELYGYTDFTERFVRGDTSRTDGGSGLGLSIAKSFTEACGGRFKLETIADLFVVKVEFTRQ